MNTGILGSLICAAVAFAACGGKSQTSPSPVVTIVGVQAAGTISDSAMYGGGGTTFTRNGQPFFSKTGGAGGARGFTVATVSATTGRVLTSGTNFDTWLEVAQKEAFVSYVNDIPDGTVVLIGVADDAGLQTSSGTAAVIAALEKRGCRRIREYGYRDSFAVIFVTGDTTPKAEALSRDAAVTVQYSIGSR